METQDPTESGLGEQLASMPWALCMPRGVTPTCPCACRWTRRAWLPGTSSM